MPATLKNAGQAQEMSTFHVNLSKDMPAALTCSQLLTMAARRRAMPATVRSSTSSLSLDLGNTNVIL